MLKMSRSGKFNQFLVRGRRRHSELRRFFRKVKTLKDLDSVYTRELSDFIHKRFTTLNQRQKLIVKPEVTILNRRPDFVIFLPNVALILLEYKTTDKAIDVRSSYLKQTRDTFRKFELCHADVRDKSNSGTIPLVSLLLIRNPSKKQNKLVCINESVVENKRYFL
jgi:hypothetical protein